MLAANKSEIVLAVALLFWGGAHLIYAGPRCSFWSPAVISFCSPAKQIGSNCHVSGGTGIGGVLEPANAQCVIIEDNCFIGARSEIAEGVHIGQGAVIAAGTIITQSTKLFDRTQKTFIPYGKVPENAVVIPTYLPSEDGTFSRYAAMIVKYADKQTRAKTSIDNLLRTLET